jgi:hypothetical protein
MWMTYKDKDIIRLARHWGEISKQKNMYYDWYKIVDLRDWMNR